MKRFIIAMRHPQKTKLADGSEPITPWGAQQTFAATQALDPELTCKVGRIVHSGVPRANQAALVVQAAMLTNGNTVLVEGNEDFSFLPLLPQFPNAKELLADIAKTRDNGDDNILACLGNAWVIACRKRADAGLLKLAAEMDVSGEEVVIVVSHSPFIETAANGEGADGVPAGLFEADAVLYTIEDGSIVGSTYIKAPLDGGLRN